MLNNLTKINSNFQPLTASGAYTFKSYNNERLFNATERKNGKVHIITRSKLIADKLEKITTEKCSSSYYKERDYYKYTQTITQTQLIEFIKSLNGYYFDQRLDNRSHDEKSNKAITISTVEKSTPRKKASKKQASTKR